MFFLGCNDGHAEDNQLRVHIVRRPMIKHPAIIAITRVLPTLVGPDNQTGFTRQ